MSKFRQGRSMAGNTKYNLKWNSHHAETFSSFDVLRSRELLVDVTLSCDGQALKAHKLILCAGSGYFERVLQHDRCQNPVFYFFGVDAHLLKFLIDFMYLGEVDVPSADLERFIQLAEALEMKELKCNDSKSTRNSSRASVSNPKEAPARKRKSCGEDLPSRSKSSRRAGAASRTASQVPAECQSSPIPSVSAVLFLPSSPSASEEKEELAVKEDMGEDSSENGGPEHLGVQEEWEEELQGSIDLEGEGATEDNPFMPQNIPPEILDPSTVRPDTDYVWSGYTRNRMKVWFCGACGYVNPEKAKLARHALIHSGERPYACTDCSKSFSRRDNLMKHRAALHSNPQQ